MRGLQPRHHLALTPLINRHPAPALALAAAATAPAAAAAAADCLPIPGVNNADAASPAAPSNAAAAAAAAATTRRNLSHIAAVDVVVRVAPVFHCQHGIHAPPAALPRPHPEAYTRPLLSST